MGSQLSCRQFFIFSNPALTCGGDDVRGRVAGTHWSQLGFTLCFTKLSLFFAHRLEAVEIGLVRRVEIVMFEVVLLAFVPGPLVYCWYIIFN